MKHPALEEKLKRMEYEKLYKKHAGRYLAWSLCGLVALCAVVYWLFGSRWPMAVLSILYSSGFVLCISASAIFGKKRALSLLQKSVSGRTKCS